MACVTYKRSGETFATGGDCGNCGLRVRELIYGFPLSFNYLLVPPAIRVGSKVSHTHTSRSIRNSAASLDAGRPTIQPLRGLTEGAAT